MKVSIIAALSADGFIARTNDDRVNWTAKEDKKLFVQLTKAAGVMVMGARTFAIVGALPGRKTVVYTTHPEQYAGAAINTTAAAPKLLLETLKQQGYDEVMICGGSHIYDMFLQAGVVTDLYITIEPLLFGQGIRLLQTATTATLALQSCQKLNDHTLALHYTTN